mmetsp:Transcript_33605/g.38185  ORF Transcript_33605/g.38185 Transcript_33605/m.38185 type:complete len:211 (-) Transcript_33605:110-742(-)
MIISSLSNRFSDHSPGCVNCLPSVSQIDSSGDLLDQNWGQSVGSQFFVDTQEIDFYHLDLRTVDLNFSRNSRDETDQFLALADNDSEMPFLKITRRHQSPFQEGNRIVKSEHVIIIFNIVLCQQVVNFLEFVFASQIHGGPLITSRQRERLLSHIGRSLVSIQRAGFRVFFLEFHGRLSIPKLSLHADQFAFLLDSLLLNQLLNFLHFFI